MNEFGTEVKSAHGKVLMRSKNLRAMLRYAAVAPVVKVVADPDSSNPYNGRLAVTYADGSTCEGFWRDYGVLLEFLTRRRTWRSAIWDVACPSVKYLNARHIRTLEKLHAKGMY